MRRETRLLPILLQFQLILVKDERGGALMVDEKGTAASVRGNGCGQGGLMGGGISKRTIMPMIGITMNITIFMVTWPAR